MKPVTTLSLLAIASALFLSTSCGAKELEEKNQKLEGELATCKTNLSSAEQAKRNLEKRLAQAQSAPPPPPHARRTGVPTAIHHSSRWRTAAAAGRPSG